MCNDFKIIHLKYFYVQADKQHNLDAFPEFHCHCMKYARTWVFADPYFPV